MSALTRQRLKLALIGVVAGTFGFFLGDCTPAVVEQFSAMEVPVQAALLVAFTALGTSILGQITTKRIDRESRLHSQKVAVYSALLDAYLEAITTGNTEDALKSLSESSSSALLLWADLTVALDWIKLKESMRSDSATEDEQDAAVGALLESIRRDLGHSDLKLNWRRFFQ